MDTYVSGISPSGVPLLYDRDGLSCTLVPVSVAAQAFHEHGTNVFNAEFYFRAHYTADPPHDENDLRDRVLRDNLGLRLAPVRVDGDLVEALTPHLAVGEPVLVPGDKSMLATCAAGYLDRQGRHVLLVKGFKRGVVDVFVVQDHEHFDSAANAPLLAASDQWPMDLLAQRSVELRTSPVTALTALRQLVGDAYLEGYYPTAVVRAAHERYGELLRAEPAYSGFGPAPMAMTRVSGGPAIAVTLDAIGSRAAAVDPELRVREKHAYLSREHDSRRALRFANSQRIFVASVAALAECGEARAVDVDRFRRIGMETATAWKREVLFAAVLRRQSGGSATPDVADLVEQETELLRALRDIARLLPGHPSEVKCAK